MDLNMLVVLGGAERTDEEFHHLFTAARSSRDADRADDGRGERDRSRKG